MLILPAEADEALVTTAVDRISKVISPTGGEVTKLDRWGRKRFAYELARQTEGYYVVVRSRAGPEPKGELARTLKTAEEVTRQRVLPLPEKGKATAPPASVEA